MLNPAITGKANTQQTWSCYSCPSWTSCPCARPLGSPTPTTRMYSSARDRLFTSRARACLPCSILHLCVLYKTLIDEHTVFFTRLGRDVCRTLTGTLASVKSSEKSFPFVYGFIPVPGRSSPMAPTWREPLILYTSQPPFTARLIGRFIFFLPRLSLFTGFPLRVLQY